MGRGSLAQLLIQQLLESVLGIKSNSQSIYSSKLSIDDKST